MTEFWPIFWSVFGTAITALLAWLTKVITNFINDKIKDRKMASHATNLMMIVMNAVQCVSQTFVDSLKKEGKFDASAAADAKEKAIAIVLSQMTPDLMKYVEENFGEVREYVAIQIESMIYQTKK